MSNKDAGTVIGRKGETIATLQKKSAANIRVSHGGEYFPGTEDRVVVIKGTCLTVQSALELMLTELYSESDSWKLLASTQHVDGDFVLLVNLLIPEVAGGLMIGKGGENIRSMVNASNAKIQLLPKEKQVQSAHAPDRVCARIKLLLIEQSVPRCQGFLIV